MAQLTVDKDRRLPENLFHNCPNYRAEKTSNKHMKRNKQWKKFATATNSTRLSTTYC